MAYLSRRRKWCWPGLGDVPVDRLTKEMLEMYSLGSPTQNRDDPDFCGYARVVLDEAPSWSIRGVVKPAAAVAVHVPEDAAGALRGPRP